MRIFLDANVLFSATKSDGVVRRLLDLLIEAGHECWADGFVAEEARRNLAAKFPDGLPVLETLLSRLHTGPIHTPDSALEDGLPLPEKDRPVLAAAIRHGCEALVTGDRAHFGRLYGKALHGVTIHSPRSIARKEAKKHGTRRKIENELPRGTKIVAIDDVITTGASTLLACKEFEEAGYEIVGILAVVDREQGGKKTLEEKYKHVRTLFKTSDFPKLASLAQKGGARAAA